MKQRTSFLVLLGCWLSLRAIYSSEKKLPSYVNVCKRYDPEISKCLKTTLENLKPYLVKGIAEFKVPPIEPFYIESIRLNQTNSRSIRFVADLVNLTFSGGKNFEIISINGDYQNHSGNMSINFPHLVMNGQYSARGRVLLFEFDSLGKVEGEFKQVTISESLIFETYKKRGIKYLRIKNSTHDAQVKSIRLYMHDLFRNNPEITENVNKAINDNIDLLYNDFKPLLVNTLGTIMTEYSNRAYAQYPYDVLLPVK